MIYKSLAFLFLRHLVPKRLEMWAIVEIRK